MWHNNKYIYLFSASGSWLKFLSHQSIFLIWWGDSGWPPVCGLVAKKKTMIRILELSGSFPIIQREQMRWRVQFMVDHACHDWGSYNGSPKGTSRGTSSWWVHLCAKRVVHLSSTGIEAPMTRSLLDLTLLPLFMWLFICIHCDTCYKPANVSHCFPEFWKSLQWKKPGVGCSWEPLIYSLLVRSTGDHLGLVSEWEDSVMGLNP